MFLKFTSKKINNNHKLLSFSNFPLIYYKTSFFGEKDTPPKKTKKNFFLENRQNLSLISFVK